MCIMHFPLLIIIIFYVHSYTAYAYLCVDTSGPCKVTVNELKKEFNISDDQLGNRVEKSDIKNLASFFGDVELYLPGLGLCEADEADVRTAVHLHGNQTGMNKALTIWINSCKATFKDLISIALDVRKANVAEKICNYLQQNSECMHVQVVHASYVCI